MANHPNQSAQTICIVNDGQYCWGAKWVDLRSAMERLGWTRDGSFWSAPPAERRPEDGQTDHYTELCELVQPAPGFDPEDDINEAGCAHLYYRPDMGGTWEYDAG